MANPHPSETFTRGGTEISSGLVIPSSSTGPGCASASATAARLPPSTRTRAGRRAATAASRYRPELGQTALLLLELDHPEAAVVEHDELRRQVVADGGDQVAEQHRQAAVAAEGDHLAALVEGLRAERLRRRVGHRAEVERADQPARARELDEARESAAAWVLIASASASGPDPLVGVVELRADPVDEAVVLLRGAVLMRARSALAAYLRAGRCVDAVAADHRVLEFERVHARRDRLRGRRRGGGDGEQADNDGDDGDGERCGPSFRMGSQWKTSAPHPKLAACAAADLAMAPWTL